MTRTETNWLYRDIPSLFAADRIPDYQPDSWQRELLDSQHRNIIILASRQSGKTKTVAIKIAHRAIFYSGTLSLVVSGTLRQNSIAQRSVVESIRMAHGGWRKIGEAKVHFNPFDDGSELIRQSVLQLELANGSRVISCPGSPDSLRGFSPDGILCIDEGSRCRDAVFDALFPMQSVTNAQVIILSAPNGARGMFHKLWTKSGKDWLKIKITADDCPRIKSEYLKRERWRMSSENMFRQEFFCEFVAPRGGLFTPEQIADMFVMRPEDKAITDMWRRSNDPFSEPVDSELFSINRALEQSRR